MLFNLIRRPSSGSYQINHFLSKITESLKNKNQITITIDEVPVAARGILYIYKINMSGNFYFSDYFYLFIKTYMKSNEYFTKFCLIFEFVSKQKKIHIYKKIVYGN